VAARRGVRSGYRAACGVFAGDAVLMLLSAAGVASLLKSYPSLFMVIKYAGAAYLAWVGLGILRGAWRSLRERAAPQAPVPSATRTQPQAEEQLHVQAQPQVPAQANADVRSPFRRAAVISLLNPKAILFFVSFFIQFVDPGYAYPALSFLVLGAVIQFFSAVYLTALILGGQFLAGQFRRRRRLSAGATAGLGALFVGFGIKLATADIA
jgi:leucine efflux protein